MAEIFNLNRARKARDRAAKEVTAEANRQKFGRTQAQKDAEAARRERADKTLDGHRRDDEP